jgi:hypothetical protein
MGRRERRGLHGTSMVRYRLHGQRGQLPAVSVDARVDGGNQPPGSAGHARTLASAEPGGLTSTRGIAHCERVPSHCDNALDRDPRRGLGRA